MPDWCRTHTNAHTPLLTHRLLHRQPLPHHAAAAWCPCVSDRRGGPCPAATAAVRHGTCLCQPSLPSPPPSAPTTAAPPPPPPFSGVLSPSSPAHLTGIEEQLRSDEDAEPTLCSRWESICISAAQVCRRSLCRKLPSLQTHLVHTQKYLRRV